MRFIVYSKPNCSYCDQAKKLIKMKGFDYEEVIVDVGQEKDANTKYITINQLKELVPNAKSVPQIFKVDSDGQHLLGGYNSLVKEFE